MAKGYWIWNEHDHVHELVIKGVFTARVIPSGDPDGRIWHWRLYETGARVTHQASSLYAAQRQVRKELRKRAQERAKGEQS